MIHLSTAVRDMFGDFIDIQFIGHEDSSADGESGDENGNGNGMIEVLTGYDCEHGMSRTVTIKAIENCSIAGLSLKRTHRGDG